MIAIMIVVVIAGAWYVLANEDEYVPELNVVLYSRSTGAVYRAEMDMEVDTKEFVDYFYPATIGTNFPSGNHELRLRVYELDHVNSKYTDSDTKKILDKSWNVGYLYGKQTDGMQEWEFTIDLPELKTTQPKEQGAVYLCAVVTYDDAQIGFKRWTINPDMEVDSP